MCCQSVAALLPVLLPLKCLPVNRVTDVATLASALVKWVIAEKWSTQRGGEF
jgi:hypothetical protein